MESRSTIRRTIYLAKRLPAATNTLVSFAAIPLFSLAFSRYAPLYYRFLFARARYKIRSEHDDARSIISIHYEQEEDFPLASYEFQRSAIIVTRPPSAFHAWCSDILLPFER